jgi:hypothetical protein
MYSGVCAVSDELQQETPLLSLVASQLQMHRLGNHYPTNTTYHQGNERRMFGTDAWHRLGERKRKCN